jgi:hypothetical protein
VAKRDFAIMEQVLVIDGEWFRLSLEGQLFVHFAEFGVGHGANLSIRGGWFKHNRPA